MENGIWNVFRNNRIEDEEQHRKGINLKKEEMTNMDFLLEAVGIVAAMIYLGLQIYYGIVYGVAFTGIILNAAILILVYVGLTLLARYPERVNNLPKEICSGKIRKYTIHMVRAVKLIFVLSLLFTSICDAAGVQINKGYSLVTVALIAVVTVVYEGKIIKLLAWEKISIYYKEKTILSGIVFSLYIVINVCGVGILCIILLRINPSNQIIN